jgi:hypothetical protein
VRAKTRIALGKPEPRRSRRRRGKHAECVSVGWLGQFIHLLHRDPGEECILPCLRLCHWRTHGSLSKTSVPRRAMYPFNASLWANRARRRCEMAAGTNCRRSAGGGTRRWRCFAGINDRKSGIAAMELAMQMEKPDDARLFAKHAVLK